MKREIAKATLASQRGMTLIEIMVVIAIIGIVATAMGFGVVSLLSDSKSKACTLSLGKVATGVVSVGMNSGFPSDLREVLEHRTGLKEKHLLDPWGEEFLYSYPAIKDERNEFDLCSKGEDKTEGTDDDICYDP